MTALATFANTLFHSGPGTQTLRNIPSNMFQNQQNANRGAPMGTNRLQNGKLGGERYIGLREAER
jgi:hypothetical protein